MRPPAAAAIECLVVDERLTIAKQGDELVLVDVRVGAEALARDNATTARETGKVVSTPLLVPTTVPGEPVDSNRIDELGKFGLVLREGIDKRLHVLEIPAALKGTDPTRWIESVLGTEIPVDEAVAKAVRKHAVASPEMVRRILESHEATNAGARTIPKEKMREAAGFIPVLEIDGGRK